MGTVQSQMVQCQFGNSQSMYLALNSKSSALGSFNKIHMYKYYHSSAKFINGKMLGAPGEVAYLKGMVVDRNTGDQFYAGQIQASKILQNVGEMESFVLKLNTNMAYEWFRTFQGSTSAFAQSLLIDSATAIYAQITELVSPGVSQMRLVRMAHAAPGTLLWGQRVYDATNLANPKGPGGITKDSTYVYSCMTMANSGNTLTQTLVFKFDHATGNRQANKDMQTTGAIGCQVYYHSSSSKLLLSITYSAGTTELVHFDTSGTGLSIITMTARLRIVATDFQQLGYGRMFQLTPAGDVWMFYPSFSTVNSYSSMFITHLLDVDGMNWPVGCEEIHQRDADSTVFTAYQIGSSTYGGDNVDSSTLPSLAAPASSPNYGPSQSLVEIYFKSPDDLAIFYDLGTSKPLMDLKFSFSATCSVWARPTTATLINRVGAQAYSVSYDSNTLTQTSFIVDHCQGLTFTYSATMDDDSPLLSWITFDADTITYTFSPSLNSMVGTYGVNMIATLVTDPTYQQLPAQSTETFNVQVTTNLAPTVDTQVATSGWDDTVFIQAHHTWLFTARYENDVEGNDPALDADFVSDGGSLGVWDPVARPAWFIVTNTTLMELALEFRDPPQPAVIGVPTLYVIQIKSWDTFNVLTPNLYYINVTVATNYAPYMDPPGAIDLALPSIQVPFSFSKTFHYSDFKDDEGDEIFIDCSDRKLNTTVNAQTWILEDNNKTSGVVTLSGTVPKDNSWAGTYALKCVVEDVYKDGSKNIYTFTMTVTPKPSLVVTGTPANAETRLPNETSVTTAPYSYDVDGLNYRKVLYVNGTIWTNSAYGTWIVWDESTQTVTVTPFLNSQAGLHAFGVMLNDQITTPLWINFTINVIGNQPLVKLLELPNIQAIVDNWFYFDFDKYAIFENPEVDLKDNFTMIFRQKDSNPASLPYFIKFYDNGTLYGLGSEADIGSYQIECVGIDDALWQTPIEFTLAVKACYYKCSACWNTDYNTCQSCKNGYFLLNTECNDFCPTGSYADDVKNQCFQCPSTCKICLGPDPTQNCTVCNTGFYKLDNGCYATCPDGYWGDNQDYYCKPCNEACTKCVGPLSSQCQRCADYYQLNDIGVMAKIGYLLVGTQCQVPKCGDGQYFKWDQTPNELGNIVGICDQCHSTCKKCVGPNSNQCVQCIAGRQLVPETHTCLLCHELNPGLALNEELECEDKCGDGVIVDKQCDDGNTNSGDGCSKSCQLEFGYICDEPAKPCREVIPPRYKITAASLTNQHFIEFSEPVTVQTDKTISPENMNVQIIGKKSSYKFSWRVVPDPKNQLIPNREIIRFSIKLYDIQSTLTGSETVRITFTDYSQIKDLTGNLLVNNSFAESSPAPFIYVSEDEASTIAGGGESMKYAFLSALGFQLGLKVIINGSMQYLWGLVHALQVFQFLLLMNIDFPPNLPAFTSYFSIASGDTGSMGVSDYIPNIKNYLIHVEDIEGQYDNELLPPKFVDEEISPYFIIAYSDKLSIWVLAIFVMLPILLLLTKICKKIKVFENILGGFFFNGPLRTIVEMYFEMVIQVVVNTNFVKFRNSSQMIATATAFFFGAFSLLLPFILMTVIYANRKQVRKRVWKVKLGMLTDEFSQKTITQLYFYPAYLFQRMTFAAVIVFIYDYPLIQCMMAAMANVAMIAYLVIVRPYKEENQQTTTVIDEIILFVCLMFFIYIYLKQDDMAIEDKKNLGWIVILIMMFSVLKNLFVVMYFGFLNMRKKMKSMFSAEDEAIDSPHTSDDDSDTIDSVDTEEIEEDMRREEYEREEYNDRIKQRQQERAMEEAVNNLRNPNQSPSKKKQRPQELDNDELDYGNNSQIMNGGSWSPYSGMSSPYQRQQTPVYLPGQMEMEEADPAYQQQQQKLFPNGTQNYANANGPIHKNVSKPARNNNFFEERPPTANEALSQLEDVANHDDDEYGYEYGGEDYGAYGQEAAAEEEHKDLNDRADWEEEQKNEVFMKKKPPPPINFNQQPNSPQEEEQNLDEDIFAEDLLDVQQEDLNRQSHEVKNDQANPKKQQQPVEIADDFGDLDDLDGQY